MASGASSSSTKADKVAPQKYEVFLSFRGPDTRYGFVSHLFNALDRMGIKTYMDDKSLERGNEIAYSLSQAIQESVVSIVVFSEKYASSRWCLDELVQILRCRKSHRQIVVPVFYHVEPTHVRNQEGGFGDGFSTLIKEERFTDKVEMVNEWKAALTTASNLSGHTLSAQSPESDKVDEIVEDVKRKLNGRSLTSDDVKGWVGIEKRIDKIQSLLFPRNCEPVRIIGVCGMGGIGKTTLATVAFKKFSSHFEGCCFLANVREKWDKGQKEDLEKKLHSDLLGEENPYNASRRLTKRNVFLVLDDVNDQDQLEFLVGDCRGFGDRSKIIVTTRDKQMLRYLGADNAIYEVEELNDDEALQLFLLKAFNVQSSSSEISKKVVNYAKGSPLALTVLGSLLRSKKKEEWESYLNELEGKTHWKIEKVLRISYDHGLDNIDRSIFLDIACFFKGENRDYVEEILDACYVSPNFSAKRRINNLIEKSLLTTIGKYNTLSMHDLVEEMGREIVSSAKEPGKRSRLWITKEICDVLKNKLGTETIEGIYLDEDYLTEEVDIGPSAFEGMHNLRFLHIFQAGSNIDFPQGHLSLPNALRYLYWYGCHLESFPSNSLPQNLVELRMIFCHELKQLWSGVQNLKNLRHINLYGCWRLTRIPDLSRAPKLQSIVLGTCLSLVDVPPLNFQVFENHTSQKKFRKDLGTLKLGGCSSLKNFPNISGNVRRLDLTRCYGIDSIPPSIKDLSKLIKLRITDCKYLKALPQLPLSLGLLDARGCKSLETVATSQSEIIQANWKDYHATHYKKFLFLNCPSLDQNSRDGLMTESYVRVLRTAILSVSKPEAISPLFEDHEPIVRICLPGNEIPNWFRHQTKKSRITIKLRPNWQTNFIGFALCSVCWIQCEYSFKTNDDNFSRSIKFKSNFKDHLRTELISEIEYYDRSYQTKDHVFIWYSHEEYHDYRDAFEISFEFQLLCHIHYLGEKRCGVHLLYRKDVENSNMQEILDDDIPELAMSDDDISESEISDDDISCDDVIPELAMSDDHISEFETSDDDISYHDISELSVSDEDIPELATSDGNEITESSISEPHPKRTRL